MTGRAKSEVVLRAHEAIERSRAIVAAMTPEQIEEMKRIQAKSWARGEIGLAEAARQTRRMMR